MIVFPMAGQSRRFTEGGYTKPKFQLPLWGRSVFEYAVSSFSENFRDTQFIFIYRETGGVRAFMEGRTRSMGIEKAEFVELPRETKGQAETVELGVQQLGLRSTEPLTIFNIDTFRRPGIKVVGLRSDVVGWLEVFQGSGSNWSFIKPAQHTGLVAETAEKVAISNLCCTGLYHFASAALFHEALKIERASPSASELYIAPIYNHLIKRGEQIGYGVVAVADMIFCGVPEEYEALVSRVPDYELDPPAG